MEALPGVLRAYHDNPGESGLSPFQIVLGGIETWGVPYEVERKCEGARAFFDRMADLDKWVVGELNRQHAQEAHRVNARRTMPPPYKQGDRVWVLPPKGSAVSKLNTWWVGPAEVVGRTVDLSY